MALLSIQVESEPGSTNRNEALIKSVVFIRSVGVCPEGTSKKNVHHPEKYIKKCINNKSTYNIKYCL